MKHLPPTGVLLALLCVWLWSAPALAVSEEQKTLDAIQKHYEETLTLKAHFVQKAYIKLMDQTQKTEGEVYIKKPGKMKWTYNAPDPQVLISRENVLWLYVPEERQANKMLIDNVYANNTPALFLAGKGKLTEAFMVNQVLRGAEQTRVILQPKANQRNLERLELTADNKTFQIVGSIVYDNLGNKTEILFTDIETNLALSEELFLFTVPAGVRVLDMTQSP
jgi:outer membrane lipoprotein carrier protein